MCQVLYIDYILPLNTYVMHENINLKLFNTFKSNKYGGIAQWQSIRLQIERSPVQLQLPPKLFMDNFIIKMLLCIEFVNTQI